MATGDNPGKYTLKSDLPYYSDPTCSKKLGTFSKGTIVDVTDITSGRIIIKLSATEVYAKGSLKDLVDLSPEPPSELDKALKNADEWQAKTEIKLYKTKDLSSKELIRTIPKGEIIKADKSTYDKGKIKLVKTSNAKVGWIQLYDKSGKVTVQKYTSSLNATKTAQTLTNTVSKTNVNSAITVNENKQKYTTNDVLSHFQTKAYARKRMFNQAQEQGDVREKIMNNVMINSNNNYLSLLKAIENSGFTFGIKESRHLTNNMFPRIQVIDPFNMTINGAKEYLFFVKPDLNITGRTSSGKYGLNKELRSLPYFVDLFKSYKNVIKNLQFSYHHETEAVTPFANLLSSTVISQLDMPNIDGEIMDGPANIYGTGISYRQSGYKSDEDHSFSLEFRETLNFEIYHFFKAYEEYQVQKQLGRVSPTYVEYVINKILYDNMGIYKIVVGDDGVSINYFAYMCGVKPMTVPRNAFSDVSPNQLKYSVDFKAEFVEDMNPLILRDFNILMQLQGKAYGVKFSQEQRIPIYDYKAEQVNGAWAHAAQVYKATINGRERYILQWFRNREINV